MKTTLLSILVLTLSTFDIFSQVDYQGYIFGVDSKNKIDDIGLEFMDINLIVGNDTMNCTTNWNGYFEFKNIKQKQVKLIARNRNYKTIDTSFEIIPKTNTDTFYSVQKNKKSCLRINYNRLTAIQDILDSKIVVLLPGGVAGTQIYNRDTIFEIKYNIEYLSLGCAASGISNEIEYNLEIFKFLDNTYGLDWRTEIRKETIGLKEYNAR